MCWCGNPLCGLCSIVTCLCQPVMQKYETLPLWAQLLLSFIVVGIPMIITVFFTVEAFKKFYYGG